MPRPIILLALAALLTGCATTQRDPAVARERAYKRLLTFIEPGMARRQLYALLPPAHTPEAMRPTILAVGVGSSPYLVETYPLDRDFSLRVCFEPSLLGVAAYRPRKERKPRPAASASLSAYSVGELLGYSDNRMGPSVEHPDDVLALRPILFRTEKRGR